MSQLEFVPWKEGDDRPNGAKVTHIFGRNYLISSDILLDPKVFIRTVDPISDVQAVLELTVIIDFLDHRCDYKPALMAVPVVLKRHPSLGDHDLDLTDPAVCERYLKRPCENLAKCLKVSIRRRQLREERIIRSVPGVIYAR